MSLLKIIICKAANLRCWFQKRQYNAMVAKHNVRMELYRVVRNELTKFVNWAYSKASKETRRELDTMYRPKDYFMVRWLGGPPDWMNDIHTRTRQVPNGGSGCTIKDT